MKNLKLYTFALVLLLFATSCSRSVFVAHDAETRIQQHQSIAILPVDVIFTGKKPKNITEEEIEKIRAEDAFLFQNSIYRETSRRTNKFPVQIQAIEVTNRKLKDFDADLSDMKSEDLLALASLLGVDAVVKAQVTKRNYLTRGQSLGVEVATEVGQEIFNRAGIGLGGIPGRQLSKTDDIHVSCSVIDASDGSTIFSNAKRGSADWRTDYHTNVYRVNRRVMRKLPY